MKTYMPEFGALWQSRAPGPPGSGVYNPPPPSMTMVNLGVLAFSRGLTMWAYIHPAGFNEVCVPGFFDAAVGEDMVKAGDMLVIRAADGTGVRVAAIDGKTVRLVHLL